MKRRRGEDEAAQSNLEVSDSDPRPESEDELIQDEIIVDTPSKRQRKPTARYEAARAVNGTPTKPRGARATPKSQRSVKFTTPSKVLEQVGTEATPSKTTDADRSARRKSSRRLIERTLEDGNSEEDITDSDEEITRELLDGEDDQDDEEPDTTLGAEEGSVAPETPSKPRRGRPKGRSRKRSPTPPTNLPPHEQYFWQNRPGGNKTSNNTLSSNALLNHDAYFAQIQAYEDPHEEQQEFLLSLHGRSRSQWWFELEQGFNICLYGYGSKRQLLTDFAAFLHNKLEKPPTIVVVNGYAPGITVRDILNTIAGTLLPSHLQLPVQPQALLELIIEALSAPDVAKRMLVLINSIDAAALRRPTTQQMLATLAALPSVSLVATADTLNFPLLWDTSLRSRFHFLFHDTTTFAPYTAEIDVVETVNSLLGRSGRRGIGGKDGVTFVLRSLPANARALFRVLVAEQVAAALDYPTQATAGAELDGDLEANMAVGGEEGVEYRLLYRKACEELICTNENGFRTLLKEFFDHQMVESRRDALGAERLAVPFRREELEALLEELVD